MPQKRPGVTYFQSEISNKRNQMEIENRPKNLISMSNCIVG